MTDIEFYFWYFVVSAVVVRIACLMDKRAERVRLARERDGNFPEEIEVKEIELWTQK